MALQTLACAQGRLTRHVTLKACWVSANFFRVSETILHLKSWLSYLQRSRIKSKLATGKLVCLLNNPDDFVIIRVSLKN